jgi:hypothetical protein
MNAVFCYLKIYKTTAKNSHFEPRETMSEGDGRNYLLGNLTPKTQYRKELRRAQSLDCAILLAYCRLSSARSKIWNYLISSSSIFPPDIFQPKDCVRDPCFFLRAYVQPIHPCLLLSPTLPWRPGVFSIDTIPIHWCFTSWKLAVNCVTRRLYWPIILDLGTRWRSMVSFSPLPL